MASNTIKVAPMLLLAIVILFTSSFVSASSRNSYEEGSLKPNNVVVKGSIFCDTQLSETAYFLPGAMVAVECRIDSNRKCKSGHSMVYVEGETDENGEFIVELPIIQNLNPRKSCSVRLLSSPHELCDIPSITTSSQLALISSSPNGKHIYVSTPLSYRASKQEAIVSSLPRRRALQVGIPPLPNFSFPPLPSIPSVPKLSVPPLPSIPPLPKLSVPPLPNAPPLPNLGIPPLSIPSIPTLPKLSFPPLPTFPSSFPPFPLFTPPPPSTNDETP